MPDNNHWAHVQSDDIVVGEGRTRGEAIRDGRYIKASATIDLGEYR